MQNNTQYHHPNARLLTKRALMLAVICSLFLFIFVWQGVEDMFTGVIDHKTTFTRLFAIILMFGYGCFYAFSMIIDRMNEKVRIATEHAKTSAEMAVGLAEEKLTKELEKELSQYYEQIKAKRESIDTNLADIQQIKESAEWELRHQSMITKQMQKEQDGMVLLPVDYSIDRNRICFVEQKGGGGTNTYKYAYYELDGDTLVIGKANMTRKIYKSETKTDSLNRVTGIEFVYTSDNITVFEQNKTDVNTIPEPYKTAIVSGLLKTETVISLIKKLNTENKKNNPQTTTETSSELLLQNRTNQKLPSANEVQSETVNFGDTLLL